LHCAADDVAEIVQYYLCNSTFYTLSAVPSLIKFIPALGVQGPLDLPLGASMVSVGRCLGIRAGSIMKIFVACPDSVGRCPVISRCFRGQMFKVHPVLMFKAHLYFGSDGKELLSSMILYYMHLYSP